MKLLHASLLMLFSASQLAAVIMDNQTTQTITAHIDFGHGTSDQTISPQSSKTVKVGVNEFSITFHYPSTLKVQGKTLFGVTDAQHITIKGDGKTTLTITR